ncbi:MAG: hypothetical protein WA584_16330 [Pyrinomonadaceae bacterium]
MTRPKILGKTKTLTYENVLESYPSMDTLLEKMIEKELRELFYKSRRDLLEIMREKFGFRQLTSAYDEKIIQLSLIRNCLAHNRGLADSRLEEANNTYKSEAQIPVNMEMIFDAIRIFRKFAIEIDKIAESQHLNKNEVQ